MQLKILKKRECNGYGKKMGEVSDQLLPKSVKAGYCISRDNKMEKTNYPEFLPTSKASGINHDRKLEERTQTLSSKIPPMTYSAEQVPPKMSQRINPSFIKKGSTPRPNIGPFNRIESPDQDHDGILSENCTQCPRYQSNYNHKESGGYALKEIPSENPTKTSLQNHSGFFNSLESQQQEISEISNRYPSPSFATTVQDSSTEPSRIFNKSLHKVRKIQTPWTKLRIEEIRLHSNSDSFEILDHEPDAASSNNRTPSPATVGRNFMDYLVANYSHGTFNPHRKSLSARLGPDPEEGCDPTFLFNGKSTPSSSYKHKTTNPITAAESNSLHHLSDQETFRRYKEAKQSAGIQRKCQIYPA